MLRKPLVVDPDSPLEVLAGHPETADIVIYCSCPNEVSAAILAERLKRAGYGNTWALAGGFEEWWRLHGQAGQEDDGAQSEADLARDAKPVR